MFQLLFRKLVMRKKTFQMKILVFSNENLIFLIMQQKGQICDSVKEKKRIGQVYCGGIRQILNLQYLSYKLALSKKYECLIPLSEDRPKPMIWKTGVYVYAMNMYACTHYSLHPALVIFLLYIKMRDHFSYTHNAQGIGLLHRRTR